MRIHAGKDARAPRGREAKRAYTSSQFKCIINPFPLDELLGVDFSMKAKCRGRFSHANTTILRRKISIRLTILHHPEDTKPPISEL